MPNNLEYQIYQTDFLTDRVVQNLMQQARDRAKPIFNYGDGARDDKKRSQCNLSIRSKYMQRFYDRLLDFLQQTILKKYPTLKPMTPVVLLSKSGCQQQAPHSDYIPDTDFKKGVKSTPPYLMILALMDGTMLNIWPGSTGLIAKEEHLLYAQPSISKSILQLKKKENF